MNGQSFEVTPNTMVYTPMGSVHRFQMFTPYDNIALITPLERQQRVAHILVEEDGLPVPTVPGGRNLGPLSDRGSRCPLSELHIIALAAGGGWQAEELLCNEYLLNVEGSAHKVVDGCEVELTPGDVVLIRAGAVRQIRPGAAPARFAMARE